MVEDKNYVQQLVLFGDRSLSSIFLVVFIPWLNTWHSSTDSYWIPSVSNILVITCSRGQFGINCLSIIYVLHNSYKKVMIYENNNKKTKVIKATTTRVIKQ